MSKTKVDSTGIDLSDNFAFTGTVSGTPGITVADQWRLTSDFTGNASPIASNLAQVNSSGQGTLGSAMTVSSGVFTFPSTGIYLVDFTVLIYGSVNADAQIDFSIYVQEGGSSYQIARGFEEVAHGADTSGRISTLMDVTNTSTIKVKFYVESNINLVRGGSGNNQTCMTFIRLGDT